MIVEAVSASRKRKIHLSNKESSCALAAVATRMHADLGAHLLRTELQVLLACQAVRACFELTLFGRVGLITYWVWNDRN